MKIRSIGVGSAVCTVGLLIFFAQPAAAQGTAVHVFISNGVKTVIDQIRPQAEKAVGHPLAIEFGTTASLKQRIEAGATFDAAVLTSEAIADLVKDGKVTSASRTELARCGIGLGVRAGAPKPDIGTPDALKRTLQNARSISYAKEGASRKYLDQIFERFGIAEALQAKTTLEPGSVQSNQLVAEGKAQYVLTLVSEILPAPGVQLVGPLPAEVQSYVSFAAGVGGKADQPEAAKTLLQFLKGPVAAPVYKAKGLDPR